MGEGDVVPWGGFVLSLFEFCLVFVSVVVCP